MLYSSLGRYALMAVGLVSTIVIARMLTPEEIGVYAMASSIVVIISEFRILGANSYLIREKELTEDKIRSAYGLTVIICWGLGLGVFFASNPLSKFFDIPDLSLIFKILSVSFIFAPYISIPNALLARRYKFKEISFIRLFSSFASLIMVVVLIFRGFSYYSLAMSGLFTAFVQFLLYIYFTRDVKVYRPRFKEIKPIAKLGVYTSLSHMLQKAQNTVPDMVIGKMGGPAQVGMFSRGLGFMLFLQNTLLSGVTPVALPYLSDVKKRNESLSYAYTRASQLIAGILWPVLAVASVASLPAIRLMFGDQWDDSAPIATVVAFWAIFRTGHILAPNALVAVGKETLVLVKEILVFVVFLFSIILAYQNWGLMGVGYAFVFSGIIDFLASGFFVKTAIGLGVFRYIRSLTSSAIVSSICWLAATLLAHIFPYETNSSLYSILEISVVLPAVWIAAVFATKHPLKDEIVEIYRAKLKR